MRLEQFCWIRLSFSFLFPGTTFIYIAIYPDFFFASLQFLTPVPFSLIVSKLHLGLGTVLFEYISGLPNCGGCGEVSKLHLIGTYGTVN